MCEGLKNIARRVLLQAAACNLSADLAVDHESRNARDGGRTTNWHYYAPSSSYFWP
jgi:hypothetical protein